MVEIAQGRARHDVHLAYPVDLVAEELDPYRLVVGICGKYLDRIASDTEHIALKGNVVALIADLNELMKQLVQVSRLTRAEGYDHALIVDGVAQAVYARHGRDHDNVAPLKKTRSSTVAQALYLIVDGAVLFDESIGMRNIRLGLVIVIV